MAFSKILVGVDLHKGDRVAAKELSPESRAAIEESLVLAIHSGGTVTFCTSLNLSAQTTRLIALDHQDLVRSVEDLAAEVLDQIVADARQRGVTADRVVRIGSPDDELAKLACEGHYDLLVVGTRSRNKATRMLFGSTAQKLIRTAPGAVWIVKPDAVREIREIAIATDLSEGARPALAAAVDVSRALSAKLYVVHAVDMAELSYLLMAGVPASEISAARTRMLEEAEVAVQQQLAATDYRTLPHGVKIELIEGSPDEAIPKFVTDNEIDILVIGTHGRRGVSRLVMGNTAERILPTVNCSVIAVKPIGFVSPYTDESK